MKNSQSSEDYLECILLLSNETEYVHRVDVARRINVSPPAVQKAVKLLQKDGLVECDGMHIYLTPRGAEYAKKVYARHSTIRNFLKLLGVNDDDADADACEMEHIVSDATFEKIKDYVENHK